MRTILRRAASLLLAAPLVGLIRPAAAQSFAPFPAPLLPAPLAAPAEGDLPPLPRVVPPDRAMPGPITKTPGASGAGQPASAVGTAQQPARSAPAPPSKSKVDLLTAPDLPAAWSATSAPPAARVAPQELAAQPTAAKLAPAAAPTKSSIMPKPLTPPVAAIYPPVIRPAAIPLGVAAGARPTPGAHPWPPAFVTRDEARPYETTGIVYFDRPIDPAKPIGAVVQTASAKMIEPLKPAAAPKPAPAPPASSPSPVGGALASTADLRQRVQTACGPEAKEVTVVNQPDKNVIVKVRVRDAATAEKALEKILQLPEMSQPTVHLQMEVRP